MDWDRTINTVAEVARKFFTLALTTCLVIVSVTLTYIVGLTAWRLALYVRGALGT